MPHQKVWLMPISKKQFTTNNRALACQVVWFAEITGSSETFATNNRAFGCQVVVLFAKISNLSYGFTTNNRAVWLDRPYCHYLH
jgi:hypothetical protein